ncbi:MAG: thiol peroxidase [Bacteroidota bacterium]
MAQTKLGENIVNTIGELPAVGSTLPAFTLTGADMSQVSSAQFAGKKLILNIFPSIATGICSASVRQFNQRAAATPGATVLCVSRDLPFALKRFCGAEGITNVITATDFRHQGFGKDFGVELIDGNFRGLFARCVIVADENGKVIHSQLVPAVGQEPDYDAAYAAL